MSNATYLRDSLGGPVDLEVLDDCYHVVTVDRQRHLVVDAIDRFVANLIGLPATARGEQAAPGKISAA
jgi:carboxylesterase